MSKTHKVTQKGVTFIEVITVLGVLLIVMGVASVSYSYHYRITGRLAALKHLGLQALQQMQNCLEMSVVQTGTENFNPVSSRTWPGCDTKAKLNLLSCEDCSEPRITNNQIICMEITKEDLKQCVAYRHSGAGWSTDKPFKVTINHKVCVKRYSSCASCVSAVWPYKSCKTNSDCETGQECPASSLGSCVTNLSQGGCI